jgi:hypothetical protein
VSAFVYRFSTLDLGGAKMWHDNMSVPKSVPPSYREQFDRMKRFYTRFSAIDQGRPHDAASDNYKDDIYAFFLIVITLRIGSSMTQPFPARLGVWSRTS